MKKGVSRNKKIETLDKNTSTPIYPLFVGLLFGIAHLILYVSLFFNISGKLCIGRSFFYFIVILTSLFLVFNKDEHKFIKIAGVILIIISSLFSFTISGSLRFDSSPLFQLLYSSFLYGGIACMLLGIYLENRKEFSERWFYRAEKILAISLPIFLFYHQIYPWVVIFFLSGNSFPWIISISLPINVLPRLVALSFFINTFSHRMSYILGLSYVYPRTIEIIVGGLLSFIMGTYIYLLKRIEKE